MTGGAPHNVQVKRWVQWLVFITICTPQYERRGPLTMRKLDDEIGCRPTVPSAMPSLQGGQFEIL